MAYRLENTPPPKPEEFLPVFDVYNNEIVAWSIPCFYFDQEQPIDWHDYRMHDYLGWPDPHHPGHACQALPDYGSDTFSPASVWTYIDMNKAIPIRFKSEYETYNTVSGTEYVYEFDVAFDHTDEDGNTVDTTGITATAAARSSEDWIVDINFNVAIPQFAGKPKEFLFNVYTNLKEGSNVFKKSLLLRGKLVVLPG